MEMEDFEKRALQSGAWRVIAQHAVLPWVLRAGTLPQAGDVLELGCGAGFNAEQLLIRFPGWRLTATDYDDEMVHRASVRLAGFEPRVRVERADATALHYPDATFDLVISLGVWHHVGAWEQALAQSARVLRPQGSLLLADLLDGFFAGPLRRLFPPVRTYTLDQLRPALRDSGYARWELGRVGQLGYRVLAERN